jgi:hypothetical protein
LIPTSITIRSVILDAILPTIRAPIYPALIVATAIANGTVVLHSILLAVDLTVGSALILISLPRTTTILTDIALRSLGASRLCSYRLRPASLCPSRLAVGTGFAAIARDIFIAAQPLPRLLSGLCAISAIGIARRSGSRGCCRLAAVVAILPTGLAAITPIALVGVAIATIGPALSAPFTLQSCAAG